jgi:hypothetical protein
MKGIIIKTVPENTLKALIVESTEFFGAVPGIAYRGLYGLRFEVGTNRSCEAATSDFA